MSESVKILIEADDQASKKIADAAKNVEASIKGIKTTGEQAKKSTEFFGSIANALGGSELGAYASQIAGVTEKTSQFAEVQKLGGAGALAFKAGLAGVVGVLSFNIGKALGDVIFQTAKWNDELAKAATKAEKLDSSLAKIKAYRFSLDKEEISLMRDPAEQVAATKELIDRIEKDIKEGAERINAILASETKKLSVDEDTGDEALGFNAARKAAVAAEVAGIEKLNDALRENRDELKKTISEERQRLDAIKKSSPVIDALNNSLASASAIQSDMNSKGLFAGKTATLDALKEELSLLENKKAIAEIEESTKQKSLGVFQDETIGLEIQLAIAKKKADIAKEESALQQRSLAYIESLSQKLGDIEAARADAKIGRSTFTGPGAAINALKEEIQLLEKKKNLAAIGQTAGANTIGEKDKIEAEGLLLKIQLATKQGELQKAEEESARRIAELKASELQKLEEQNILLTKGAEAAYAFNLEKQGLSKQDAADIAAKQKGKATGLTQLQAFESRLLTRGPSNDPAKAVATNTAAAVAELKALNARLEKERQDRYTLKVVRS